MPAWRSSAVLAARLGSSLTALRAAHTIDQVQAVTVEAAVR
jgi:hypothetical protein